MEDRTRMAIDQLHEFTIQQVNDLRNENHRLREEVRDLERRLSDFELEANQKCQSSTPAPSQG